MASPNPTDIHDDVREPDEVIEPGAAPRGHSAIVPRTLTAPPSGLALAGPEAAMPALARLSDDEFTDLVAAMQKQVERIGVIHRSVMKPDVHYGKIPGTEKDTLLQPGADLLIRMHNGVSTYPPEHLTRTLIPQPDGVAALVVWDAICEVRDRTTGTLIGVGSGSCNSHESKYRYRNGSRRCPACGKSDGFMRSKRDPEWFCWAKRGGCGATFALNAPAVMDQVVGKIENVDVMDLDNTIKKMAMKRAKVSAANEITLASGTFTQDLEDLEENERARDEARGRPPVERGGDDDGGPPPIGERQPTRAQSASRTASRTVDDVVSGGARVTGGAERAPQQQSQQARQQRAPAARASQDQANDWFSGAQ